MIGVPSQVEELLQLRSAPKRDDIRELRLAQRLQGVVIASALDVESVNARIDYETAHLQEVHVYLSARRDRRVDLLNLGNLLIGGGVGAVGSGLQLISSAEHARNVVSTSAGFGGTETAKRTIALTWVHTGGLLCRRWVNTLANFP